jgi:hypothetical protein
MNKPLKLLLTVFILLAIFRIGLSAKALFFNYSDLSTSGGAVAIRLIELTNEHRISLGLPTLATNSRLTQAAINKAGNILTEQYFNHTSPDGRKFSDWIKDVNYKYFYVGENLAIDFNNAEDIFSAWLKSDRHRENIERQEFQEIGIAVIGGNFKNKNTLIAVQLFGSRVLGVNEASIATIEPSTDLYFPTNKYSHQSTETTVNYALIILGILIVLFWLADNPLSQKVNIEAFDILRITAGNNNFNARTAKVSEKQPSRNDNKRKL